MQKKITKQIVDAMTIPAKGEASIMDSEVPGFGVRAHSGGSKVYLVRYRVRVNGVQVLRKQTIGATNTMSPVEARGLAREVLLKVAAGEDPMSERKRAAPGGPTIEAMFKARVAHMRAMKRAMADHVERMLLTARINAADALGRDTPPGDITPADVVKFVSGFYSAGHRGAADKARSYLAAAFSWAITSANDYTVAHSRDWGVKTNPAAAVAKDPGAKVARDRHLSAAELGAFWRACANGNAGFSESTEVALRTIMACGQRVQETLRLEGADLDLDAKLWIMPAHKTKGQVSNHIIPLPDVIIPDLRRMKEKHGDGTLFPAKHDSSASGIISPLGLAAAVRRFVEDNDDGVAHFQTRDLRRTWKSRAGDGAGIERFTRDLIQQHAKNDTGSKHYDYSDYLPQMRKAMDDWSAWLERTASPPPDAQLAMAA